MTYREHFCISWQLESAPEGETRVVHVEQDMRRPRRRAGIPPHVAQPVPLRQLRRAASQHLCQEQTRQSTRGRINMSGSRTARCSHVPDMVGNRA